MIPGLGGSPGDGKGYPLQYSDLENSTDCIVHGVTKSQSDFHLLSSDPLYFCSISYNISSSISNFIYFRPLFFLVSLAKGSSILFIFSENQLSVLLIFFIVLLVSILFLSDCYYLLSFADFVLCFIFVSCFFRCKVKLFF